MATSRENKKNRTGGKGGENPLAEIEDEVKNSPFNFMDEKIRISKIIDPEQRKTEEIKIVMKMLAMGVGEASAQKIKEYADRIKDGTESEEKVKQGLSEAFIKGIDDLLAIYRKENKEDSAEETAVEKAIEEGEAKVEEVLEEIQEAKEKGEDKAEILGGEEGKESLAKDLEPIEEDKKVIVENTQKAKRTYTKKNSEANNQDQKPQEVKEQPNIALIAEQLEKATQAINKLKEEGEKEALELANLQALESAPVVNTPELKETSIEDVFDSFNEEDEAEYSKLLDAYLEEYSTNKTGLTTEESMKNFHQTEEIQDLLKRIKSRIEKEPTKAELLKRLEGAEKKQVELGEKIKAKEVELAKIDNQIDGVENKKGHDKVLEGIEQNQNSKKEGWWNRQTEGVKNTFNKSLDWWNKDYSERTTGEKVAKSLMSAGFISAALYFSGEKLDLLPQDTGFGSKVGSRTFMAGLASAVMSSDHAQRFAASIKEGFSNLSKTQKIAALGALGVAGVGGFMYFAGAGALAATGVAIGARFGSDKLYNKNIEGKKSNLKSKEEQIAEIKRQIAEENNGHNSKYISLDINALNQNLDTITKDIEKLNGELRRIKTFQSLTRGAISIAGGIGTMAAVNASKLSWQEILENKKVTPEEIPEVIATDSETKNPSQDTQEIIGKVVKNEPVAKTESESWLDKVKNWWNSDKKTGSISENKYGPSPTELIKSETTEEIPEEVAQNETKTNTEANESATNTIKATEETTNTNQSEQGAVAANTPESKINIPKEAIIDGKERVGITYAFRDQLRANTKMAEAFDIDPTKLDDAKYVATEMKNLAIKLGYMDDNGHEIRISEDGVNKVAYVLKIDGNGNPMVEETNIATGEVENHYQGASFEGKDYEKAYETYSDNKYDYRPRVNLGPDNDPVYPGQVTDIGPDSDPVEMSPGYPGAVTDAKNTIDTKLNTGIYNYETVIKSPSWGSEKYKNFLNFINVKNPSFTYSPEEQKIYNFLKADYDKALNKYPGINEYLLNKNLNVEDARKLLHSVNQGGLKEEIIQNTVADKEVSTHDNKEYDYSNNNIEEIRSSNKEFKEIQEVAKSAEYKLTQEELKNVQKVFNKNLETIFGKDKSLWNEDKYEHASTYMKQGDETPLSKYLNDIKKLGKDYAPKNKLGGLQKEQIYNYLIRITIKAEKDGQLELIKPKVDGPDELYQDIKTGTTEVTTRKTVEQKDDLYN